MPIQFLTGKLMRVSVTNFYGYPQLTAKNIKTIFTISWNVVLKR